MKYVSIDIETTGLDPEKCQILQIGAVIEDTKSLKPVDELPSFKCLIEQSEIVGSPFAIYLNREIISALGELERAGREDRSIIRKKYNILPANLVAKSFRMWLEANGISQEKEGPLSINVAGKNFAGFDKQFMQKLPGWNAAINVRSRVLDPAILCVDWEKDGTLPNLETCMQRSHVEGQVTHDALQDATDVVRTIRGITRNYSIIYF